MVSIAKQCNNEIPRKLQQIWHADVFHALSVKSEDYFIEKVMQRLKEKFWTYNFNCYKRDAEKLNELERSGHTGERTEFLTKKIMNFVGRSIRDIWNDILVEECKPIYPNLTKYYLKNYILLRKHDVDFKDTDEEWMEALAKDPTCKNMTYLTCYRMRQAFIPANFKGVSFEVYRERHENPEVCKKVNTWQLEHPGDGICKCCLELDLPYHTVSVMWDENCTDKKEDECRPTDEERQEAREWKAANPGKTMQEYMSEKNISCIKAEMVWNDTYLFEGEDLLTIPRARTYTWKLEHPDGTQCQCAKELKLKKALVCKYWEETYHESEARALIQFGDEHKRAPMPKEAYTWKRGKTTRAEAEIALWRNRYPDGTPEGCIDSIGRSKPTVQKYWETPCTVTKAKEILKTAPSVTGGLERNFQRTISWVLNNPNGTVEECAKACSVDVLTVRDVFEICEK